jgi:P27 family predicted phage terminase small subunit
MPTPRKPQNVHALSGSWRAKTKGPQVLHRIPEPPPFASERTLEFWPGIVAQLEPLGVVCEADAVAILMLADAMADYVDARDVMKHDGHTIKTPAGIRAHPAVRLQAAAHKRMQEMMDRLGMNPVSRAKLERLPEPHAAAATPLSGKPSRYAD